MSRAVRRKVTVGRAKSCGDKKPYGSRADAQHAADTFARYSPGYLPRVPYACPYDPTHFHIGKPLGQQKKRTR